MGRVDGDDALVLKALKHHRHPLPAQADERGDLVVGTAGPSDHRPIARDAAGGAPASCNSPHVHRRCRSGALPVSALLCEESSMIDTMTSSADHLPNVRRPES